MHVILELEFGLESTLSFQNGSLLHRITVLDDSGILVWRDVGCVVQVLDVLVHVGKVVGLSHLLLSSTGNNRAVHRSANLTLSRLLVVQERLQVVSRLGVPSLPFLLYVVLACEREESLVGSGYLPAQQLPVLHGPSEQLIRHLVVFHHHFFLRRLSVLVRSLQHRQLLQELFLLLLLDLDVVERSHLFVSNLLQVLLHQLFRRHLSHVVHLLAKLNELLVRRSRFVELLVACSIRAFEWTVQFLRIWVAQVVLCFSALL